MVECRFTTLYRVLCISLLGLAACAKVSDPLPPQLLVPKPATDLKVAQYADKILLSVSMPGENTDGSRVLTLGEVEIFRLAGDRANPGPLPQETFLAQAERIQNISAGDMGHHVTNGVLNFWDVGSTEPGKLYGEGYLYAIRFINRKNQTAGFSNQVFIAPVAIPVAPETFSRTLSRDGIQVTWTAPEKNMDGSTPARIAGYNIFRSENPKDFPPLPLNAAPLDKPEFVDRSFEFDKSYYYRMTVVGSRANPFAESLPSAPLAVVTLDTFPPGMPKNLSFVVDKGIVTLLWGPPDDADIAGYRIYRMEEGSMERLQLQEDLVTALSFRDDKARAGKTYQYGIAAVDTHKNEGLAVIAIVEVQ
jgi:hypothetical protein